MAVLRGVLRFAAGAALGAVLSLAGVLAGAALSPRPTHHGCGSGAGLEWVFILLYMGGAGTLIGALLFLFPPHTRAGTLAALVVTTSVAYVGAWLLSGGEHVWQAGTGLAVAWGLLDVAGLGVGRWRAGRAVGRPSGSPEGGVPRSAGGWS